MSKWGQGVVTNKGMDLIARSQLGEKITFTRIKVGDGELGAMDPMTLNDLVSVVTAKAITDARQLAFGSFRVRATFAPGDMPRDFWWHEVGVFAKGEDNVEVLYLHNAASQTSFIPRDGLDVLTVQLPVYIGNAQNVTALVDESAAYILRQELLEEIKKVGGPGSGLDADTVDTKHASDFATAAQGAKADAALPLASYTAADVLAKAKTVDGAGSGLDADLLDGQHGAYYATKAALDTVNAKAAADIPVTLPNGMASNVYDFLSLLWQNQQTLYTRSDEVFNRTWPVGSVYLSMSASAPTNLVPGSTWTRIAQGRALFGVNESDADFNTSGRTGGQKSVILTENQIPSHGHPFQYSQNGGASWQSIEAIGRAGGIYTNAGYAGLAANIEALANWQARFLNAGGGQAHNNTPEYFTLYVWRRTA